MGKKKQFFKIFKFINLFRIQTKVTCFNYLKGILHIGYSLTIFEIIFKTLYSKNFININNKTRKKAYTVRGICMFGI